MRWSQCYIPTLKEAPGDAEVISHKLLLRAGILRKLTAGIYTWLPLGLRTLSRSTAVPTDAVENIVSEYGSLQALMDDVTRDPAKLGDMGVNNPPILVDSLYRMWGKKG